MGFRVNRAHSRDVAMRSSCGLLAALLVTATSWVHSEQWSHGSSSHGRAEIAACDSNAPPLLTRGDARVCALCLGLAQARTGLQQPVWLRSVATAQAALALRIEAPDPPPELPDLATSRTRAPPATS
jgi:hypothetical protein